MMLWKGQASGGLKNVLNDIMVELNRISELIMIQYFIQQESIKTKYYLFLQTVFSSWKYFVLLYSVFLDLYLYFS